MPVNFPNGLSIDDLPQELQSIARELDQERAASRGGADVRGDGRIGPSEVQWGLDNLRLFDASTEAPRVAELARLFGLVSTPRTVRRTWEDRASFDTIRWPTRAVAVGENIYVRDEKIFRTIPYYDANNDAWTTLPIPNNAERAIDGYSLGRVDNKLVFTGGRSGWEAAPWMWVRDVGGNDWQWVQGFKARTDVAMAEDKNKLYLFGGKGNQRSSGVNAVDTAQVYDSLTNTISDIAPLPEARTGATAIAFREKLYVIGGQKNDGTLSNRVDIYNTTTNAWENPVYLRQGIRNASAWIDDGKIHISGGKAQGSSWTSNAQHEVIDPATNAVSDLGVLPSGQYDYASFARTDSGRLFLIARDPDYHQAKGNEHTKELTVKDEPPQGGGSGGAGGDVYNNITIYNTYNIEIENVQKTVVVNNVENNTITNIKIENEEQIQNIDLDVLPFAKLGTNIGFFDGDFYLRTEHAGKKLLRVDTDEGGQRHFIGQAHNGRSPAPKNERLFLYQPASEGHKGTLIQFTTDKDGQFRVPLPQGMSGAAYIFQKDKNGSSGAAVVDIPAA